MKKIFAISVLSVMAVVGTTNAWANAPDNRNLATVSFVERSLGDFAGKNVIGSNTTVGGTNDYYSNDYVPTTAWVNKQDEKYAETIAASLDTKVDRAQVIKSDDKALSDGTTDLSSEDADEIVPTVGMVEANFVPNEAQLYDYDWQEVYDEPLGAGDYVLTVSVDNAGNKVYVWRAMKIGAYHTSAGGNFAPK